MKNFLAALVLVIGAPAFGQISDIDGSFTIIESEGAVESRVPQFLRRTNAVLTGVCSQDNPTGTIFGASFADFDGDGLVDWIPWDHGGTYVNCYAQNQGDGTWQENATITSAISGSGNTASNFNGAPIDISGDGAEDSVGAGTEGEEGYFRNDNDGLAWTKITGWGNCDPWIADIDGDNDLEASQDDGSVRDVVTGAIEFAGNSDLECESKGPFSAVLFDLNGDGWPDVFNPQDGELYQNDGDGTFSSIALDPDLGACAVGAYLYPYDYDLDGDADIICALEFDGSFSTNTHALLRNDGAFQYTDVTPNELANETHIVGGDQTNKGCGAFGDLDNDGYSSFILFGSRCTTSGSSCQGARVTQHQGGTTWDAYDTAEVFIPDDTHRENGRNCGDLFDADGDGDQDIVMVYVDASEDGPMSYFENQTTGVYRFLKVRISYQGENATCLGCKVEVFKTGTAFGQRVSATQFPWYHPRSSTNSWYMHFGVGNETAVDLRVTFPHAQGSVSFSGVSTNQRVEVEYAVPAANSTLRQNVTDRR